MSLSFGKSEKKTKTSQTTNPWGPTIPGLEGLIGQINSAAATGVGPTDNQQAAYDELFQNLEQGNPFEDEIHQLSSDMFGASSNAGDVEEAYADITRRLSPTADGANLDVNENPYLQEILQNNSDDIFNRLGAKFAGAGREWTGNAAGQKALGKGISEGVVPTLFNQYNLERANQNDAAKTLFGAGKDRATIGQALDTQALSTRSQGVQTAQDYLDSLNYAPNQIINLEEQMKDMPAEDLANFVTLLGSIAGLGGQSLGTGTQKGTSFGAGVGDAIGGIGSIFKLLSDERMKEGVDGPGSEPEKVGELADGTPIYRYRYKGTGGPVQIGVMAQDVERDHPDAVSETEGVKFVDYDQATDEAARAMKKKKKGGGKDYA